VAVTAAEQQEVRAVAKWVRMSPRKARLVAEHIRGRSVPEARTVLAFTPRAAARELEKVLRSAVANAEANHGLVGDELVVSAAYVDEGPVMKRWRARARGRVARIRKPTCHITIKLTPAAERPIRESAPVEGKPTRSDREVPPEPAEAGVRGKREVPPEPAEVGEEPPAETAAMPEAGASKPKATSENRAGSKPEGAAENPKPKRRRAPRKQKEEADS
jgi:large subunit ribosomal protein L22